MNTRSGRRVRFRSSSSSVSEAATTGGALTRAEASSMLLRQAHKGRVRPRKARPAHMRYEAPESLEGAVALLAGATGEARVLAGGTDLPVQMRADIVDPELIVDIKKIAETRAVTLETGGWRIGAAVTGAELKEHA